MDRQLAERGFESSDNYLDLAIQSLNNLRLTSNEKQFETPFETCESALLAEAAAVAVSTSVNGVPTDSQVQSASDQAQSGEMNSSAASVPTEGSQWVDLLLQEMRNSANLEDARKRATRALEAFEKIVASRSGIHVEMMTQENTTLKEKLQRLAHENHILKRGVAIQHARLLGHEETSKDLQAVKQLLTQHQQQFRSLELENYSLSWHLRKAREERSIPGQFHPDLF